MIRGKGLSRLEKQVHSLRFLAKAQSRSSG